MTARVLVISPHDNVGTALDTLAAGQVVDVAARSLTVCETVPRGHKVALTDMAAGDAVIKYGNPIGVASASIAAGSHVHVHNVVSARGRGDVPARAIASRHESDPAAPRLAEPADSVADVENAAETGR